MEIGEVARRSGVAASALRYYESRGLIRSVGRTGARRVFSDDVLDRLAFVALGRAAGLSLAEIGGMIGGDGPPQIDRAVLARKADVLDVQIRQLEAMRDGLRHAANCGAEHHLECPTFRRLLAIAAARTSARSIRDSAGIAPRRPSR